MSETDKACIFRMNFCGYNQKITILLILSTDNASVKLPRS